MKKIKYSDAISLCMEWLDYLILGRNNKFIYCKESRTYGLIGHEISIQLGGFVDVIKFYGTDLPHRSRYVPTHLVLNRLIKYLDGYGYVDERPEYEKSDALKLVESKTGDLNKFIASGKIDPLDFFDKNELEELVVSKVLYARFVECYSKAKEELILSTRELLLDDSTRQESYKDVDTLVDLELFKRKVLENNSESFSDNEVRGTYDPCAENPYMSRLGLDGYTR